MRTITSKVARGEAQRRDGAGRGDTGRLALSAGGRESSRGIQPRGGARPTCVLANHPVSPLPRVAPRQGPAVPNFAGLALRSCPELRGNSGPAANGFWIQKCWWRGRVDLGYAAPERCISGAGKVRGMMNYRFAAAAITAAACGLLLSAGVSDPTTVAEAPIPDATGLVQTVSTAGGVDTNNPFFLSEGTNGRTCASCHVQATGWGISPPEVALRFLRTAGTDPIFRPVDGATCPSDDVSTVWARLRAYQLLLTKGLIRIELDVPANADFQVTAVDTPYACKDLNHISIYRRPLPATNLRFLTTVMWDGRESPAGRSLHDNLFSQSFDAIEGHAQGDPANPPSAATINSIVAFESSLYTAQVRDFRAWTHSTVARRAAIARGEAIFNRRPITITGVNGLNDALGLPAVAGTCTTCHNTPNVGDHSVAGPLNIGIADASRRTPDLPLYTVSCNNGETVQTTDLGRALVSGKCSDIGKFKGPIL